MENTENSEQFRNSISTVSKEGKRVWVYPKRPSGKFHNARKFFSVFLLFILFGVPFMKYKGHPFLLLNIIDRNFIIFGQKFGPQDFYLFVLGFIAIIVSVVLFTAIYGRIFCGWACPQTVFLEMVFRKIEYFIEGDSKSQRALAEADLNFSKLMKKSVKHLIFYILSFIIANTFLAYIIGVDELFHIIQSPPSAHLSGFISIHIFTIVFYLVFSFFREQACIIVCPYGRLQSVLLDKNSLVVAYDYVRGEPRGKIKKNESRSSGDCIDCNLCVDVCPTGIDIRNGIQLECVNCTACIDACDEVMDKVKKPRGLVRYDSQNGISDRTGFKFTPRLITYTAILIGLISVFSFLLVTRSDFSITLLRTPGTLYQSLENNKISNIYDLIIINKTYSHQNLELKIKNLDAEIKFMGDSLSLASQQIFSGRFMVIFDKDKINKSLLNIPISISVLNNGHEIKTVKTNFLNDTKQ